MRNVQTQWAASQVWAPKLPSLETDLWLETLRTLGAWGVCRPWREGCRNKPGCLCGGSYYIHLAYISVHMSKASFLIEDVLGRIPAVLGKKIIKMHCIRYSNKVDRSLCSDTKNTWSPIIKWKGQIVNNKIKNIHHDSIYVKDSK